VQDKTNIYIQNFKNGNKSAFDDIVNEHKNWVISMVLSMVHNKQDAEDISQDVFVSVYFALDKFKKASKFETWLYRIIINKVNAFYNKLKIKNIFNIELSKIENMKFINDESLFDQFDKEILHKAVVTLSSKQRNVVLLRIYQGLSFKEISSVLNITVNVAKVTFHQAKNKLKKRLML
tara:strand:- start:587 stop:1120 length:534 start_codon:yes stop_codon:yes gene_type:complete